MSDNRPTIERHIQTVLGAVIIAAIIWVGNSITNMSVNQARLEEQVATLSRDLQVLNAKVDGGILPKTEQEINRLESVVNHHKKLFESIWPRLREMKERVQHLEPKDADRWQH